MEALYKKLYEKYTKLKAKRFSQLDNVNDELERKFHEYLTAADAYVNQLKGENEKLLTDIDDLRNEVASLRSSKDQQYEDCQKLLLEVKQKNEELTKEIESLQKLQESDKFKNQETDAPQDTPVRKRKRLTGEAIDHVSTPVVLCEAHPSKVSEPSLSFPMEKICNADHQQPQCCQSSNDSGPCNCLFQVVVECLTGMKVSVSQSGGMSICALHQSSGYSFELTWMKKAATEDIETEFLYQVSSLGTFERVAPEWMRETMIFSSSMCPVFFERVSRVIKHH